MHRMKKCTIQKSTYRSISCSLIQTNVKYVVQQNVHNRPADTDDARYVYDLGMTTMLSFVAAHR